jgi:hypothetical protein
MALCLEDLQSDAREIADVRAWTAEKPWWAVGLSAGAGFLTSRALFSAPNEADRGSKPRSGGQLGALIVPLVVPLLGMALGPVMRAFGARNDDDGLSSSPLERLALGPIVVGLLKRFA